MKIAYIHVKGYKYNNTRKKNISTKFLVNLNIFIVKHEEKNN